MSDNDPFCPFRKGEVLLANQSVIHAVCSKWELNGENEWWTVPKGEEKALSYRAGIVGLLLENQEKWFDEMEVAGQIPDNIVELFGENWRKDVYTGILKAWRTTPLVDICSVQPVTGPQGQVAFYSSATINDSPEIQLGLTLKEVQVASYKTRARLTSSTVLSRKALIAMAFEEQLVEATREVLSTMFNAASVDEIGAGADVLGALQNASDKIFRETQRAPANNIVAGSEILSRLGVEHGPSNGGVQKVGTLKGRWNVYADLLFPKNQLLAWHQGPTILDTGIVYSPYRFGFSPIDSEGTNYAVRARQKVTMAHPNYARVVSIKA